MKSPHFSPSKLSIAGYTLVEVLVVVILIGILAAIAAPNFLGLLHLMQLNAASSQVYQAMRQAQSNARREKTTWQASFRQVGDRAQWAVHRATLAPGNAAWHDLPSPIQLDWETTLQMTGGVRRIKFDYRGTVAHPPLGRVTLSIREGGAAKRCVFVSTILGTLRTSTEQTIPQDNRYCY